MAETAAENDPIYCSPIRYPAPAKKCMPNVEPHALQEHMSTELVASPYERQSHVPAPLKWGTPSGACREPHAGRKRPHFDDNAEQI